MRFPQLALSLAALAAPILGQTPQGIPVNASTLLPVKYGSTVVTPGIVLAETRRSQLLLTWQSIFTIISDQIFPDHHLPRRDPKHKLHGPLRRFLHPRRSGQFCLPRHQGTRHRRWPLHPSSLLANRRDVQFQRYLRQQNGAHRSLPRSRASSGRHPSHLHFLPIPPDQRIRAASARNAVRRRHCGPGNEPTQL